MFKKAVFFLFLLFSCEEVLISSIDVDELNTSSDVNKKYNFSICAIFKNKAEYLKEWIEYHRILGVEHFYLYNIESRDFFQPVLAPYIRDGVVTLVNWPELIKRESSNAEVWALNTQIPAYENAVNFLAREETKWLVFVDIDEFLECPNVNITELLEAYKDYPGISLCSEVFDREKQTTFAKRRLGNQLLESQISKDTQAVNRFVTKMIFKPDLCQGFVWPPYECRFKTAHPCAKMDRQKLRITRTINKGTAYSSVENKITYKPDLDYRILSEYEGFELLSQDHVLKGPNRSVYERVPEFLKKLQRE